VAKIVAIGASQGGVRALRILIGGLPPDFPAPVLAVQHIGARESILPSLLNEVAAQNVSFALHREPLVAGRIYIAPPDHHMLVRDGRIALTRGPWENWARPAIDPLFRTAALHYGPDAIGIVLSGRLNDGTAGLLEIKQAGGVAVVQTPREAEAPDMPQSALDRLEVDYCLPVAEMARLLVRLAAESNGNAATRSED
jgi:two-component system chemotaxis response regulator CheB